jgi:hypothetical protein
MGELNGGGIHLGRVSFHLDKANANDHLDAVMGVGAVFT